MTDEIKTDPKPWRRDMVSGVLNGKEVWAHWDLSCDPITAATLGLPWSGKPREPAQPDFAHALVSALELTDTVMGSEYRVKAAVRRAHELLCRADEEDSRRRAEDGIMEAMEILRRAL